MPGKHRLDRFMLTGYEKPDWYPGPAGLALNLDRPLVGCKKSRKCGLFIWTIRDYFKEDDVDLDKWGIFDYWPSTSESTILKGLAWQSSHSHG
jgi:hypothetical protein